MFVVGRTDVKDFKRLSNVTVVSCRRFPMSVVGGTAVQDFKPLSNVTVLYAAGSQCLLWAGLTYRV